VRGAVEREASAMMEVFMYVEVLLGREMEGAIGEKLEVGLTVLFSFVPRKW
jgi:hypothetical protein